MRPFLTVSRQEVVALAVPWDPQRIIGEYLDERDVGATDVPSAADVAELSNGGVLRFDLQHRLLSVEAELHLDVLEPRQLGVDLAALLQLRWWLWPLALPFRPRLRRWIHRRVDEMLDELREDVSIETPSPALQPRERDEAETREDGSWTLKVLSPSGRTIYERSHGLS